MDEHTLLLQKLYSSAWGCRWPRTTTSIEQSLLNADNDNDDDASAAALPDKLDNEQPVSTNRGTERRYECLQLIQPLGAVFNAPTWFPDVLVVRDEYILLYDALENNYAANSCIIIAGHPGIGKTMFFIYALLRRLEHKLPTAIHFAGPDFFLFTENGVGRHSAERSFALPNDAWALSDGNSDNLSPCLSFRTKSLARLIHTSPSEGRMTFSKQRRAKTLVSELPTLAEIAAIATTAGHNPADALELAGRWGPCIRTIMDILEDNTREAHATHAARAAALRLCADPTILGSRLEPLNGEGSALVFLRPERKYSPESDGGQRAISSSSTGIYYVPTYHLASIMGEVLRHAVNERALDIFRLLSPQNPVKSYSARLLEQRMHGRLVGLAGGAHRLVLSRETTHWKVDIKPADDLLPGTVAALKHTATSSSKSLYWLPSVAYFPGVDGVLIDYEHVYAFHATDATEPSSPRDGLTQLWRHLPADVRARRAWRYVVVCDAAANAAHLAYYISKGLELFGLGDQDQKVEVLSA